MPELQSITLLEQPVQVSHVVCNLFILIVLNRTASGACCVSMRLESVLFRITERIQVIAPHSWISFFIHTCNAESDIEWAYWFADEEVSCLILRIVIFLKVYLCITPHTAHLTSNLTTMLKPILHTLMAKMGDEDAINEPFQFATHSLRVISDTYNQILASAGVAQRRPFLCLLYTDTRAHRSALVCAHSAGKESVGGCLRRQNSEYSSSADVHRVLLRKPWPASKQSSIRTVHRDGGAGTSNRLRRMAQVGAQPRS